MQERETSLHKDKSFSSSGFSVPVHGCIVGNVSQEILSKQPFTWCNKDKCEYLELSKKNTCLKYQGPGKRNEDAAAARTTFPVPNSCAIFYFEIRILSAGRDGFIGIGLSGPNISLNRLPGWESNSLGYHGDDGNAFRDSGTGTPYGPTFTTGDVEQFFFTKNGLALPIAFRNVHGTLYPTVGLQTPGELIEANFGTQDFVFDLSTYAKEEKLELISKIIRKEVSIGEEALINNLLGYLIHQGYALTATAFSEDTNRTEKVNEQLLKTLSRHRICSLVCQGNIDEAMKEMEKAYPVVLQDRQVVFELLCQKFVELIRRGAVDKAVELGKTQLTEFIGHDADNIENANRLSEISALLAYEEPLSSPASYLLEQSKREAVAELLHNSFLSAERCPRLSCLEKLVHHLQVTLTSLLSVENSEASLISLEDFLVLR
eukprot:jgi/Galph1/4692/GphlegSOOS_G3390.1